MRVILPNMEFSDVVGSNGAAYGQGLIGHNNEVLQHQTVEECSAACCARTWCKSFDYAKAETDHRCVLADADATIGHGRRAQRITTINPLSMNFWISLSIYLAAIWVRFYLPLSLIAQEFQVVLSVFGS